MRCFDRPPRHTGMLRGIGIGVLVLLIVPPLLGWKRADPPEPRPAAGMPAAADTGRRNASDTLPSVPFTVTRVPLASGDTLVRVERDSSFIVLRTDGSAPHFVDASEDVREAAGQLGTVFGGLMVEVGRFVMVMAALLLAIPLLLAATAVAWAVGRRRTRP